MREGVEIVLTHSKCDHIIRHVVFRVAIDSRRVVGKLKLAHREPSVIVGVCSVASYTALADR